MYRLGKFIFKKKTENLLLFNINVNSLLLSLWVVHLITPKNEAQELDVPLILGIYDLNKSFNQLFSCRILTIISIL